MIKNYFKIAWRNLLKYKFISFINLFGLAIGLTCCLLILVYILNELSYDRYNTNAKNIYRVTRSFNNTDGSVSLNLATVAPPVGYYLPTDFPEIKKMTRLLEGGNPVLRYEEKIFTEKSMYFADEQFFNVFTADVVKGNAATALTEPLSMMLTEKVARKYFGDADPINKVIRLNDQANVKITGIFKPFPANAHIHPEMLLSFNTLKDPALYGEEQLKTNWGNNAFFTYLLMPDNFKPEQMVARFPAFMNKNMGPGSSKSTKLNLQKLTDIHLFSHTDAEAEPNGDMSRVYIFSAIALFILLIACINYMNLSTARSALRAKEIGIRKVSGANKKELILQFLSESVLICLVAILLAAAFTAISLPWLNEISGQELSLTMLAKWQIVVPVILTPFVIGILSGLYPALFMSSFQPVKTLKGVFKTGGQNISFRKVLVITQFSISIVLIIATVVVYQQLKYVKNASLGYDKDHIVTMMYTDGLHAKYESFRNALLANAQIGDVARSSRIPTGRLLDSQGATTLTGDSMQPVNTEIKYLGTDYDFIPTYGLKMAAGRNFSRSFGTDTAGFIINEATVRMLGWKSAQEAVGKPFGYASIKGQIIGVTKDFHFESMHQKIVPMIMVLSSSLGNNYGRLSVRVTGNTEAAIASIKKTWDAYLPEIPFEYTFLNDQYSNLYENEQRQGSIFVIFACIAILIACLGLFGLSAFAISQRVKEIGVRKVLGASTGSIVTLLSKEFLLLVGIASFIAFPLAWYAMNNWLKDFAYHASLQWWIFLLAGGLAALVALATVSFQAVKAALANPVKSLRSE